MATDTAFLVVCLTVFRRFVPQSLRLFLISLAIFDDVGAILVISVAYSASPAWIPVAGMLVGFASIAALSWLGIRSTPVYACVALVTWACCDASGFHPTIVGVVLAFLTPSRHWVSDERLRSILARVLAHPRGGLWSGDTIERRDLRRAAVAAGEALSPLERYELLLHPWVAFVVMPLFVFANAGVLLHSVDLAQRLPLAIGIALVVGKPAGVLAMTWLAERLRLGKRSRTLGWPHLCAGSLLTGMGFTMAIFMAQLSQACADLNVVKVAILASSTLSAALGCTLLLGLSRKTKWQAAR
jgi:NhaA family Na+:H+ antiporter